MSVELVARFVTSLVLLGFTNGCAMISWTVEKCPERYDEYRFTLDARHREKARTELNETDENRDQSLAQIREWIAKSPHIRKCRTDALFLLRFLRMRKFSVPRAQESLERYLVLRQSYPQWFKNLDPLDEEIRIFNDAGFLLNLGRDSMGRTVLLVRPWLFDSDRFTVEHQIRQVMLVLENTLDEEETQINGYVVIEDFRKATLKHFSVWGINDTKNLVNAVVHTLPVRIQQIHTIGVPKLLILLADIAMSQMSEKIRSRVFCHKSLENVKKYLDFSLLTTDYEGGSQDPDQLKKDFLKYAESKRQQLLAMYEMEIDILRYKSLVLGNTDLACEIEAGLVGSFKNLNVD